MVASGATFSRIMVMHLAASRHANASSRLNLQSDRGHVNEESPPRQLSGVLLRNSDPHASRTSSSSAQANLLGVGSSTAADEHRFAVATVRRLYHLLHLFSHSLADCDVDIVECLASAAVDSAALSPPSASLGTSPSKSESESELDSSSVSLSSSSSTLLLAANIRFDYSRISLWELNEGNSRSLLPSASETDVGGLDIDLKLGKGIGYLLSGGIQCLGEGCYHCLHICPVLKAKKQSPISGTARLEHILPDLLEEGVGLKAPQHLRVRSGVSLSHRADLDNGRPLLSMLFLCFSCYGLGVGAFTGPSFTPSTSFGLLGLALAGVFTGHSFAPPVFPFCGGFFACLATTFGCCFLAKAATSSFRPLGTLPFIVWVLNPGSSVCVSMVHCCTDGARTAGGGVPLVSSSHAVCVAASLVLNYLVYVLTEMVSHFLRDADRNILDEVTTLLN
uniref:Uncharacterized protein n=1 Tax=Anopheles farauti TaxID=69004 RepID=A0A182QXL6_9DIPT